MSEYRFTTKDEQEQQRVETQRLEQERLAKEREEAAGRKQSELATWLETFPFIPEVTTICTELVKANGGSAPPVESWKGIPYTKGSYIWDVAVPGGRKFKVELVARDGLTQWFSAEDWPARADLHGNSYVQLENATLDPELLQEYLEKATGLPVRHR
ncbi:MAG TPA: hypothetical protein VET24_13155 [Actinomycetota bacterium]|nr:hypothetical protein [Actinomycetota bacterium]